MNLKPRLIAFIGFVFILSQGSAKAQSDSKPGQSKSPVSVSVYDRTRIETWQWFAAPPQSETYSYTASLLRLGIGQSLGRFDWQLEMSQPSVLGAPDDAVSPDTAKGQMGLGATYYASNGNNSYPAAAFLKQAHLRYRFGDDRYIRLGRFEFFDGQETKPKDTTLGWLQTNRIAQRLVGNFGFSAAQRSFDGVDAHWGKDSWDVTAMAGRADQGVFNMNGNPELNVDLQYLAVTHPQLRQHILWRAFALGYHDGRTGITKTDNRALAVRKADHQNIRVGTYGGDFLAAIPSKYVAFDVLGWGVLQNGQWGELDQHSYAGTLEAGFKLDRVPTSPWLRGGYYSCSGDNNPNDRRHETFFQVLPTPWIYAHFPFYNLMNNRDGFVQVIDHPTKRIELRSDVHSLALASNKDLWYLGGGAYDSKVFGYVGRPSNGHTSLATVFDVTSSWQATRSLTANFYYGHAAGKSTVAAIYPADHDAQFGYAEIVYHWGEAQRTSH